MIKQKEDIILDLLNKYKFKDYLRESEQECYILEVSKNDILITLTLPIGVYEIFFTAIQYVEKTKIEDWVDFYGENQSKDYQNELENILKILTEKDLRFANNLKTIEYKDEVWVYFFGEYIENNIPAMYREIDMESVSFEYIESINELLKNRNDYYWGDEYEVWDTEQFYYRIKRVNPKLAWYHKLLKIDNSYLKIYEKRKMTTDDIVRLKSLITKQGENINLNEVISNGLKRSKEMNKAINISVKKKKKLF